MPQNSEIHSTLTKQVSFVIDETLKSHRENKLDPDDVTIGAIKIVRKSSAPQYPFVVQPIDRTTEFYPDFKTEEVVLPWGNAYSYPIIPQSNETQ